MVFKFIQTWGLVVLHHSVLSTSQFLNITTTEVLDRMIIYPGGSSVPHKVFNSFCDLSRREATSASVHTCKSRQPKISNILRGTKSLLVEHHWSIITEKL